MSYLKEKIEDPVQKTEITAVGIRHADHATLLYQQKLALTSPVSGGRSVGIVRSRNKVTELLVIANAEVKKTWAYTTYTPPYIFMA
jgi:hypothetical protein